LLIWIALVAALAVPIIAAAFSPYLAYRSAVYIAAGFAGIAALGLLLVQPLLIGEHLPGLTPLRARRGHRWVGGALVGAVVVHVGGLWITSPPDVIDALTFTSPTPFSAWGVVAMWAVFATACLAAFRRRLGLRPATWRGAHSVLAVVIAVGTVVHAVLIEGTMGTMTKIGLCVLVGVATLKVLNDVWKLQRPGT